MKHQVFSIYDSKAMAYLTPFFLPNVQMAIRVFADCCNSDDHQFGKHPEDYTMFHLGEFDDETCKFEVRAGEAVRNGLEVISFEPVGAGNGAGEVTDHGAA